MKTEWLIQYLSNEDLYYLVEIDDDIGVIGEHFFEDIDDAKKYIKDNSITVKPEPRIAHEFNC